MSAHVTFSQAHSEVLVVSLSGHWGKELDPVVQQELEQKLREIDGAIKLEPGNDFSWDSHFPVYLYSCMRNVKNQGCSLDLSAMPVAVRKLLQLANAVPPNTSAQSSEKRPFAPFAGTIKEAYGLLAFLGEMVFATLRLITGRSHMRGVDALTSLSQAGPKAIGIITLISILVGMILAYLGMIQLQQFGAEVYVANLVGLGMVREMGALMTAVIMAGRTGAAWAAELGAMKVNEEVDALTTMGIRPMDFLVMPRLLAMVIMMPLLCIYSFVLGIVGGAAVVLTMNMTPRMYISQLLTAFGPDDIAVGCFKGAVFGLLIVLAGCRSGMECGGSSAAVGQATTRAVVSAIVYIVMADAGMNLLFFHLGI